MTRGIAPVLCRYSAQSPGAVSGDQVDVIESVSRFILSDRFPCVGAKAAYVQNLITFGVYGQLQDMRSTGSLYLDLVDYVHGFDVGTRLRSFVAVFPGSEAMEEAAFELMLWERLSGLALADRDTGTDWAEDVSADPADADFSMSVAGHPFFVVGMHPDSSRMARQAPCPLLVFNSTRQFSQLKADGRYDTLQKVIREREIELQGHLNPNLAEHGQQSEARQYSGRATPKSWRCPVSFTAPATW